MKKHTKFLWKLNDYSQRVSEVTATKSGFVVKKRR